MIPKTHPRYKSLVIREKIVNGVEKGITGISGLIAQGRGEAFDYLIGEKTTKTALLSEKVAAAMLLIAKRPVISVNGNVAALVPNEIIKLSEFVDAFLEVNLFYRTQERVNKIIDYLYSLGSRRICKNTDKIIPGIEHSRKIVASDGIYIADVVLVPLEDGDRCKALVDMGKKVITIDLNPFSRTSMTAHVSIVDNITRAIPNMINFSNELKSYKTETLENMINEFDNQKNLVFSLNEISKNIEMVSKKLIRK